MNPGKMRQSGKQVDESKERTGLGFDTLRLYQPKGEIKNNTNELQVQEQGFLDDLACQNVSDTSSLAIMKVLINVSGKTPVGENFSSENLYKQYASELLFDPKRPLSRIGNSYKGPNEM